MTITLKKAMLTTFAASALFLSACSNNAEEATDAAADAPVQQPETDVSTTDMAEAQDNNTAMATDDTAMATDDTAVATADGMNSTDDMNNMDMSNDDVAVATADDTAVLDGTESEEHVSTY